MGVGTCFHIGDLWFCLRFTPCFCSSSSLARGERLGNFQVFLECAHLICICASPSRSPEMCLSFPKSPWTCFFPTSSFQVFSQTLICSKDITSSVFKQLPLIVFNKYPGNRVLCTDGFWVRSNNDWPCEWGFFGELLHRSQWQISTNEAFWGSLYTLVATMMLIFTYYYFKAAGFQDK